MHAGQSARPRILPSDNRRPGEIAGPAHGRGAPHPARQAEWLRSRMDHLEDPSWLKWTKRIQAIAQTGLTFTRDQYDHERYEELQEIAAEMMAAGSGLPDSQKVLDLFRQESGYAT